MERDSTGVTHLGESDGPCPPLSTTSLSSLICETLCTCLNLPISVNATTTHLCSRSNMSTLPQFLPCSPASTYHTIQQDLLIPLPKYNPQLPLVSMPTAISLVHTVSMGQYRPQRAESGSWGGEKLLLLLCIKQTHAVLKQIYSIFKFHENPLLGIYPQTEKRYSNLGTQMFTEALFTTVQRWKQSECPTY